MLISGQVALYIFMWFQLLNDSSLKGMDFISFYTAGRIARLGHYHQLYDLESQRAIQYTIVDENTFPGGVNLSQHPPYLAPLLSLLAVDKFVQSYILWTIIRLIVMFVCGELIRRFLYSSGWDARSAIFGALGCLSFFPFFLGLLGGQDTAFIMLGLFLWMFGLLNKKEASAGFGLALASLSPLIVGALGLPFLVVRRKASFWFIVASLLFLIYSLLLIGFQGGRDFLNLMAISSQGEGFGLNQSSMYNLLGLLLRSFPNVSAAVLRLISWGAFSAVIIFLVIFWWNKRDMLRIEHVGIAVSLAVFTLPHLHIHGLSYLLLPVLSVMGILWNIGRKTLALSFLPLTSSLMLMSTLLGLSLEYIIAYLFMLVLAVCLSLNLYNVSRKQNVEKIILRGMP